jgi:teichoic acid transport system permease protein
VTITLTDVQIRCQGKVIGDFPLTRESFRDPEGMEIEETDEGMRFVINSRKNSVLLPQVDSTEVLRQLKSTMDPRQMRLNIALLVLVDLLLLLVFFKLEKIAEVPLVILRNRSLVLSLGKNDFRTKFAGSMFGTVWAFVQPIVTVLVYWFVFEKALNVGTQSTKAGIAVPYLLWLLGGLVPWFFFSDAWSSGTNVMMEYSYLVKKVVFNISCLPVVKVLSAFFVHLFFIVFTVLIYAAHGYYPTLYMLQCLYYTFGMMVLAAGLIYFTGSLVVFFRDLSQIVNILLQVGVWFTPIMWNIDAMNIQGPVLLILKLNPMYYVVMGYRDSLINHVWFWERPMETIYFWAVTLLFFVAGTQIFRRLKIHFADVL